MLDYEEALTRKDSLTGDWYDCSAHMLWIGERTRELGGAHVEFFAGVNNPLGVKLGPTATAGEVLELCERLNPARRPGRLTLIVRMGAERLVDALPPIIRAVRDAEHPVVWTTDPMHANVFRTSSGVKTRSVRGDHGGDRRLLLDLPERGRLAGRDPHRVHRRGRHRVSRRLGRSAGRGAHRCATRASAIRV